MIEIKFTRQGEKYLAQIKAKTKKEALTKLKQFAGEQIKIKRIKKIYEIIKIGE